MGTSDSRASSRESTPAEHFVEAPGEVLARQQAPSVEDQVVLEADQGYPDG
jgi:hypothetical protein